MTTALKNTTAGAAVAERDYMVSRRSCGRRGKEDYVNIVVVLIGQGGGERKYINKEAKGGR